MEVGVRNGGWRGPIFINALLCPRYYVWGFIYIVSYHNREAVVILWYALKIWDAERLSNFPKITQYVLNHDLKLISV